MTSLVSSTLQKIESARTQADSHQIAVELIEFATPLDIKALTESFLIECAFRTWLVNLYANVTRHRSELASFSQQQFSSNISLYSNDGNKKTLDSNGGNGKVLVIAFCGNGDYLQAPTAVVLQYFPDEAFDILVLRDPERRGFSGGMKGYADSFSGLIDRLRVEFDIRRYRDIRCFGCSAGGAAAFAAGALLTASSSVSFGGRPPAASRRYGGTPASSDIEVHIRAAVSTTMKAFAVFGAKNANDVIGAQKLAELTPLELVPIADVPDHAIITALHKRGDLAATLGLVGLV